MTSAENFSPDFLARLLAGDRSAFADFVDRTSTKVYSLLRGMLGSEQDAEDALQETYLKAFKALPSFENRSNLTTWLYRIAANEALMQLRKRKSAAVDLEIDEDGDDDQKPFELVDWCCLPEEELLTAESKTHMRQAIERLSPALRSVFLLRDIEDLSVKDTAEVLGINESAVKTRLMRARLKLREDLSIYFKERLKTEGSHGNE